MIDAAYSKSLLWASINMFTVALAVVEFCLASRTWYELSSIRGLMPVPRKSPRPRLEACAAPKARTILSLINEVGVDDVWRMVKLRDRS